MNWGPSSMAREAVPLLSRRPPVDTRGLKRAAAAGLGVVAVLALSAATSRAPRPAAAAEPPAALAAQLIEQSSQLFKRTYTSIDAFKDGAWLAEMLGLLLVEAQVTKMRGDDGTDATATCAHRLLLSSMDGFQFHFFQSFVTPEGPRGAVGDFIANWTAARGDLSADDYVWDALALPSATLYAPWITPFVHRLNAHGVPMLRWRYARAPKGTEKRWMYSLLVTIPHAGLTLELTSEADLDLNPLVRQTKRIHAALAALDSSRVHEFQAPRMSGYVALFRPTVDETAMRAWLERFAADARSG